MNIHEYQAKELLAAYGIPVPRGQVVKELEALDRALEELNAPYVVKAQVHAGGRGKGRFTDGYQGGVKLVQSAQSAQHAAKAMWHNTLVTEQTGPQGRKVRALYVTEACDLSWEYYLALVFDNTWAGPVLMASAQGGMDIETLAEESPEKLLKLPLDPAYGPADHQCRQACFFLGLGKEHLKAISHIIKGLFRLHKEKEANLIEINPLILDKEGQLMALDAKMSFDENSLFRHEDIVALRDIHEEDPREVAASQAGLNYIALEGTIACLVNGAGLAMATMDIIQHYGGSPANFLDVGGGATQEQVAQAFRIILKDKNVKGILVNIFGGIMQCDVIAKGILAAAEQAQITLPIVVRLEGTRVEEGRALLQASSLALTPANSLDAAAQAIVAAARA